MYFLYSISVLTDIGCHLFLALILCYSSTVHVLISFQTQYNTKIYTGIILEM